MADLDGSNGLRREFKAVGRANIPGRLSYSMATGMAKYGGDAVVPDMLHAKYLRSPYGRVTIKSMDIGKAKALPGVVEIVTWEDPEAQEISSRGAREPLIPRDAETENQEIGAIVVAETPEICDEALRLIEVEWDVMPTIVDALDGIKPGAPAIKFPVRPPSTAATGDVEAGFREAAHVQVDGGIDGDTIRIARDAGADVFVSATFIFKHPDGIQAGIKALRDGLEN